MEIKKQVRYQIGYLRFILFGFMEWETTQDDKAHMVAGGIISLLLVGTGVYLYYTVPSVPMVFGEFAYRIITSLM